MKTPTLITSLLTAASILGGCTSPRQVVHATDRDYSIVAPEDGCLGCLGEANGMHFEIFTAIDVPAQIEDHPAIVAVFGPIGPADAELREQARACGRTGATELMILRLEPGSMVNLLREHHTDEVAQAHGAGYRPLAAVVEQAFVVDADDRSLDPLRMTPGGLEVRGKTILHDGTPLPSAATSCPIGYRMLALKADRDGRVERYKPRPAA